MMHRMIDQPEAVRGAATILLVEDNEDVRLIVGDVLRWAGYQVHEADDGIEALRLLEESGVQPQLVLTDVMMPRMTGPQLAMQLQILRPTVKVLFMSAYLDGALEAVCGQHHVFIPKPFNSKDLIQKVHEAFMS